MRRCRFTTVALSVGSLALAGTAIAQNAAPATPAKPPVPSLSDLLTSWGLTTSGYVDGTYGYSHNASFDSSTCGCKTDYNSFALNQVGLTLAMQPSSGFGALVNVVDGSNPYNGIGNGFLVGSTNTLNQSATAFYLMQGFAQYVTGQWTLQGGKFATLAGAEVWAPTGNTNVTRSILFNFEPVTHTGVRATFAANSKVSLILGVNNGWTASQELADGSDKTLEFGMSLAPSKVLTWTLQGYYGRDYLAWAPTGSPLKGNSLLLDTVLTWNATSALTVVGSLDYGNVGSTGISPSASWWGVAGYLNYTINPLWRLSLRGEYFDDTDGYLTGAYALGGFGGTTVLEAGQKLSEVTLTFGYDPSKNFELRIEGRSDFPNPSYSTTTGGVPASVKSFQGWLEALYHFSAP